MLDTLHAAGLYTTTCFAPDGRIKWVETARPNLITVQGKNVLLDSFLSGSAYTAQFYMSTYTASAALSTSTYAVPTVTETLASVIAARTLMTWVAASAGSKSAATTNFAVIGTATLLGNMVLSGGSGVATVGNTAATGGVLLSSSAFSVAKSVSSGDSLAVTFSLSV